MATGWPTDRATAEQHDRAGAGEFAYVMIGKIYKVARIVSDRDGVCIVAVQGADGPVHIATERGVDPRSGLPIFIEPSPANAG